MQKDLKLKHKNKPAENMQYAQILSQIYNFACCWF